MNMEPQGEVKIEFFSSQDKVNSVFDIVTAVETLEHIPDEELLTVLTKLSNKFDDEGCLIVSVPTLNVPVISKHHRHYGIEELRTQIRGLYRVEKTLYVHRHGWLSALLRRMEHNRFMTLEFLPLLSFRNCLYKRFLLGASPRDGANVIAPLTKG